MSTRFAAIDIETANADFASICQVGVVTFDDGRVVDEWQSLVNPEDCFDSVNVSIHGIREDMVALAPTLPQLHETVIAKLRGHLVVCHTAFDRVSLKRACERCALACPDVIWLDSARVARRAWPDLKARGGYGLRTLAQVLSVSFTAHVAVEDARTAGWIVVRAIAETGLPLDDWVTRVEQPVFSLRASQFSTSQPCDPDGPLADHVIVFTGTLSMSRAEAAAIAARAGSTVRDSVSRETTLLVVGDQDIRRLDGHSKSSKHRKAEALVEGGATLRILGEGDFLRLVAAVESS